MIPRRLHIPYTYISLSFEIVIPFLKTYSTNFLPKYSRVDHKNINFTVICNSFVHSIHMFYFYLSFFVGLCWVSIAVRDFSACGEQGLLSGCGVRASHRPGFSCEALAPALTGFRSFGTWAR